MPQSLPRRARGVRTPARQKGQADQGWLAAWFAWPAGPSASGPATAHRVARAPAGNSRPRRVECCCAAGVASPVPSASRGLIHVRGSAGGQVGAAYRGSLSGMKDGTILVEGSAGIELGMRMRRGVIAVRGPVKDFAGLQRKGGTIVLMGGAEIRTGAWMVRGTIVSLKPIRLLPTFAFACAYNPVFLRLYAKSLQTLGFTIPTAARDGAYARFTG